MKKILQILNFIAVIATIFVNFLANYIPLNGKYTGELSDTYPNLFVPAGITFAIWGVIYILLILFAVYQARDLFGKQKYDMPYLNKISFFFVLTSLANILWIFFWHYEQVILSLLAMIVLFVSLITIYLRLNIGEQNITRSEKFFIHVPFSVYLGWITVATIANVTAVLVSVNWDGFGISEQMWTILVLIVATIITLLVLLKRKDIPYSAVIVWAFIGIVVKRFGSDSIYGVQSEIAYSALGAIIIILIAIAVTFMKHGGCLLKTKP